MLRRLLPVYAIVFCAACESSTGPAAQVEGLWRWSANYNVPTAGSVCSESGVLMLTPSGASLNASWTTTGVCQPPIPGDSGGGNGSATGRFSGGKITLQNDGCTWEGTLNEPQISGTASCAFDAGGRRHTASGTWQATRVEVPEHLRNSRWVGTTDQADPRGGNGPMIIDIRDGYVRMVEFWAEATVGCRRASTSTKVNQLPGWPIVDGRFTIDNTSPEGKVKFRLVGQITSPASAQGTLDLTIRQEPDAGCAFQTGSMRWTVTRQ